MNLSVNLGVLYVHREYPIHKSDMFVVSEGTAQKLINKDGTAVLESGFDNLGL